MPGLLRSLSQTDSMRPLAGSTINVDEIEANRREQHFFNGLSSTNKYGSLISPDSVNNAAASVTSNDEMVDTSKIKKEDF